MSVVVLIIVATLWGVYKANWQISNSTAAEPSGFIGVIVGLIITYYYIWWKMGSESSSEQDYQQNLEQVDETYDDQVLETQEEAQYDFEQSVVDEVESLEQENFLKDKVHLSRARAVEKYPLLEDNNSQYRRDFDRFIIVKENDPDFEGIFTSPHWPEVMADLFSNELKNKAKLLKDFNSRWTR